MCVCECVCKRERERERERESSQIHTRMHREIRKMIGHLRRGVGRLVLDVLEDNRAVVAGLITLYCSSKKISVTKLK